MAQLMQDDMALTKDIEDKRVVVAGDALQPVATATTVRVRGGNS
jgi:hypothetical protein